MPTIHLTSDQKAQLVGWLNHENDYCMAIRALAEKFILPRATGTLELIINDYEWIQRVRETVKRCREDDPDLSESDLETLVDAARANRYADRDVFWKGIIEVVTNTPTVVDSE